MGDLSRASGLRTTWMGSGFTLGQMGELMRANIEKTKRTGMASISGKTGGDMKEIGL